MSDTMNRAELAAQHVELLPARTVLSLFTTDLLGAGESGTRGENGQGMNGFHFLGMFGWGGSNSVFTPTDPAS